MQYQKKNHRTPKHEKTQQRRHLTHTCHFPALPHLPFIWPERKFLSKVAVTSFSRAALSFAFLPVSEQDSPDAPHTQELGDELSDALLHKLLWDHVEAHEAVAAKQVLAHTTFHMAEPTLDKMPHESNWPQVQDSTCQAGRREATILSPKVVVVVVCCC